MKMKRNAILLVAAIVLLAALTVVVLRLGDVQQGDIEETPSPTSQPMINLVQKSVDDVKSVTITYRDETYTLVKSGEAYVAQGHPDKELNAAQCSAVFSAAASVYAQEVIRDTQEDLSDFGLSAPMAVVEVAYTDGSTARMQVGDKTPGGNAYYMLVDGDSRVLTMTYATAMNYLRTLNSLRVVADITTSSEEFAYLKLEKDGKLVMEIDIVTGDEKVGITTMEFVQPWRSGVNAEKLATMLDSVGEFFFGGIAAGDFSNLAAYGLDSPAIRMELRTQSKSYTLLVGGASDIDGYSYAKLDDSDIVYYIGNESLAVLDTSPYVLMDKLALLVGIGTIQSYEFQGFDKQIKIDVEQTHEVDENGEAVLGSDGQPKQTQNFYRNGKQMPDDQSRYFYQYCVGIAADSPVSEGWQHPEYAVASIIYTRLSGEEARLDFYEYNTDFYAIAQNGNVYFTVRKEKVRAIADAIEPYLAGTLERNISG